MVSTGVSGSGERRACRTQSDVVDASAGRVMSAGEALSLISDVLDRVDPDRSRLDPAARLGLVSGVQLVVRRVQALERLLVGEAAAVDASERAAGTPLSSWLSVTARLSRREAAGMVHRAQEVAGRPLITGAALAGRLSTGQVSAMGRVLDGLADRLDEAQQHEAEAHLVELASSLDADQVGRVAGQVLARVVPDAADELVETGLQREAEQAYRDRSLQFIARGGSVRFEGSLPRVEAEQWLVVLDAHTESARRTAIELRDPLAVGVTPQQRRADGLIAMIHAHQRSRSAPPSGGDRPRIVVHLDFAGLLAGASGAGLIGAGEKLSAGELRRLCCDAELIPAVLGTDSQVLDVGQSHRLVTPGIRVALGVRDGGCVFPGCQARPAVCEAHHIRPWWQGGATALSNLVLLCHHHHGLLEPARYALRDQWRVRIGADQLPECIPPRRLDPDQRPLRHNRFAGSTPGRGESDPSGPPEPLGLPKPPELARTAGPPLRLPVAQERRLIRTG